MLLTVGAVLLLAGCQGNARYENLKGPPRYQSAGEIRNVLDRAGLGCEDYREISQTQRDIGEKDAREVATCRVENTDAAIMMWLKLGEAQDWARSYQSMGCRLAKSVGTGEPVYVDGGHWTIAVNSRQVADDIADAVGGRAKFPECSSVD